jgi:hypothetical protein
VIRFNCPHCQRRYELPEALARLALMCKGCGQPLSVPETSTEPEPRPEPPKPVTPPLPPLPPPRTVPQPPPQPPVAVATAENRLPPPERPSTNGPPVAKPKVDALFERPDTLAELGAIDELPLAKEEARGGGFLGGVVDVAVVLALIAIGVVCGELLVRRSTMEVLREAASAPKFPPVDLLMWLSPTVLLMLIYALLLSRGRSIGSWLRNRAQTTA